MSKGYRCSSLQVDGSVLLHRLVFIALKACALGSTLQLLTQKVHLFRQLPAGYFRSMNADYARLHGVVVRD